MLGARAINSPVGPGRSRVGIFASAGLAVVVGGRAGDSASSDGSVPRPMGLAFVLYRGEGARRCVECGMAAPVAVA